MNRWDFLGLKFVEDEFLLNIIMMALFCDLIENFHLLAWIIVVYKNEKLELKFG